MNGRWTTFLALLLPCIGTLRATAEEAYRSTEQTVVDDVLRARGNGLLYPTAGAVFASDLSRVDRRTLLFQVQYNHFSVFFQTGVIELDESGNAVRVRNPLETLLPPISEPVFPDDDVITSWVSAHGEKAHPPYSPGYIALPSRRLTAVVRVETVPDTAHAQVWYLDAASGRIVFSEPLFQTQTISKSVASLDMVGDQTGSFGAVYLENPRITPDLQIAPIEHLDADAVHLYGRYARVETCVDVEECKQTAPLAVRSDTVGAEFVFSPNSDLETPDPFAEVNAYYNINSVADWIHTTFGWDKRFGGETWIQVKVGRYWDNAAYYAGSDTKAPYILFGKTEEINFAYDADTARHEYGHAINDLFWDHPWSHTDGFGLNISMNAIEESLADLWALNYTGDPLLNGEPGYSRNADNRYTCPGNMVGEGHLDARFVDGFGWDLRKALGRETFENVLYRSLSFLSNEMGYGDFVAALESAATSLADEGAFGAAVHHVDDIREAARARGLLEADCRDRIVPLANRQTRGAVGYGRPRTRKMDYPFPLQWKITIPSDGMTASLSFSWIFPETNKDGEPVLPGYRVHVRRVSPIEIVWREGDNEVVGEPAFTVVADDTFDDSPQILTYPTAGIPASTAGESFYVMLSARTEEPLVAVQARLDMNTAASSPPPPSDETAPSFDFSAATGTPSCQIILLSNPQRKDALFAIFNALF